MIVQILVDNPNSYIVPYAKELVKKIANLGYFAILIHTQEEVKKGNILFLLSCERLFKNLSFNDNNIVIHASSLPEGRGWSPMTWQILEGKNEIFISLFEAIDEVDAGIVYLKKSIKFSGDELLQELQERLSTQIIDLAFEFVQNYQNISGKEQIGEPTFYKKRTPKDSELDIYQTIDEQFNLLRICDNEKYPAFFYKNGIKYILKIEKQL